MKGGIGIRIFICIGSVGLCLYAYIMRQNAITELRLRIPVVAKELHLIKQENTYLQFSLDQLQNPHYLLQLAEQPPFSHLKYPTLEDILFVEVDK